MEKSAKIYVAGHRGLVGSAIWNNLLAKDYSNLIGRTHKELDLLNGVEVERFFAKEKPDYVILAAAFVGGILANNTLRADFIYQNLQIQSNVIYQSYKYKVKKLLFLGSTCIYPKNADQPMTEGELLRGVLEYTNEPYAIAKIAGLKMCESFNLQYGTNFISVMPTNLYGPNDNFDLEKSHVLPAMIRKFHLAKSIMENNWEAVRKDLSRLPISTIDKKAEESEILGKLGDFGIYQDAVELWGSGKPMREFLWSEDLADACVFLMENVNFSDLIKGVKEVRNTHINIGTGREISISALSLLIAKTVGYQGQILFDSTKPDGTLRKLTDVSKLNNLGWKHSIEIPQGVEKIYKWYLMR